MEAKTPNSTSDAVGQSIVACLGITTQRCHSLIAGLIFCVAVIFTANADVVNGIKALAEKGDAVSQYHLGYMYEYGRRVPKDPVLAYMWYSLAAARGHREARKKGAILGGKMSIEEFNEAQRLIKEWEAKAGR